MDNLKRVINITLFACFMSLPTANANQLSVMDSHAQANQLIQQGNFESAANVYESLLKLDLLSEEKQKVLFWYESLMMQWIFSRFPMEESELYEVVPGDSLYKIAMNYKTTIALIKKSNGLNKDTIFPGMKLKVIKSSFRLSADKSENVLKLYLNDKLVRTYPISSGINNSTPVGEFTIVNKLKDPTWYKAGAVVPPDSPDNILGTRWMGFDYDGYGIHGTTLPESIGKQESAGCIRMLNADVEELYSIVPMGTKVTIVD